MPSKKDSSKKKKKALPFTNLTFKKDERLRLLLGFTTLCTAFFLALSFISFLFTWNQDQDILDIGFWEYFFNSDIIVENWGAKLGAKVSYFFIHKNFGIASFSVILFLTVLGMRFLKYMLLPLRKTARYSLLATILASITFGFLTTASESEDFLLWDANLSGLHGYYISKWISSVIGNVGMFFLLIISYLALFIYTFNIELSKAGLLHFFKTTDTENKDKKISDQEPRPNNPVAGNTENDSSPENTEESLTTETENGSQHADTTESFSSTSKTDGDRDTEQEFSGHQEGITADSNKEDNNAEIDGFEIIVKKDEEEPEDFSDPANEETDGFEVTNTNAKEDDIADKVNSEIQGDYDPTKELSQYMLPSIELLENHDFGKSEVSEEELIENKNRIVETLEDFKIKIDKIKATIGPTVTLYEIIPAKGVRISKIKNLEDDIALSLAALGIRIIAPIPGKGTIGIEVPNKNPEVVAMRTIIQSKAFQESKADLPIALGKTIQNDTFVTDLAKMPHLLIAGATGQGKSVGLNAVLASLLYKKHPSQLKFVLVDPKKVELTLYSKIENHFLAKMPDEEEAIITDTQKVVNTLESLCIEMDERYELLKAAQVRNLKEYNAKFIKRRLNPEKGHRFMPYVVVVIDEFADLIMTAGKEVEQPLARLAQLARAIGIHLIIATQRPTTNIITGVIKANFPARIAFRVSSSMDSRTILDSPGANQLIGKGDMLVSQGSDMIRVQCAFVDTPEIEKITDYIGQQQGFGSALMLPEYSSGDDSGPSAEVLDKKDSLFEEAARMIVMNQQGSTSLIQRKFSIGYNRAGRIVDQLEAAGIVGPFEGAKARQVLIVDLASLEQLLSTL